MPLFLALLFDHLPEFLALLAATGGTLYLLLKKHIGSIFDPLFFFLVVNEAFCISDVIFMLHHEMIEPYYAINYFLTEGALFLGILQFKPSYPKMAAEILSVEPPEALKRLFEFSLALLVGLNLLVFYQRGIPLFLESRMVVYTIGGGWGLVSRVFDVLLAIILYYLLEILRRRNWGPGEWAVIAAVAVLQILGGAKSGVVTIVFMIASFCFYTGSIQMPANRAIRILKVLTLASAASILLVTAVQSEGEIEGRKVNLLGLVGTRLVSGGDALIYAYPNGFIEDLDGTGPVSAIFKEYLSFFRLAKQEDLPKHIGGQIADNFLGPNSNFQTNAKHNLFGYVYFGYWGALLFSYLVGTGIGLVRYVLPRLLPGSWVGGVPFLLLHVATITSCNDFDNGSRAVLSVLVMFLPFLPLALLARQLAAKLAPKANTP